MSCRRSESRPGRMSRAHCSLRAVRILTRGCCTGGLSRMLVSTSSMNACGRRARAAAGGTRRR
eukprot:885652-Prymnesium_polylepis.1